MTKTLRVEDITHSKLQQVIGLMKFKGQVCVNTDDVINILTTEYLKRNKK